MKLTDKACKNAKPTDKRYKITDGGGLYLEILPTGGKSWQMKYYFNKKPKVIRFGLYPTITLQKAREKREEARKLLSEGIDPAVKKKEDKALQKLKYDKTFENVALEWHEYHYDRWKPEHANRILKRLKDDVFPKIGYKTITEITPQEVLFTIKLVEERGALDLAKRMMQYCSQVFRYAVQCGIAQTDPTVPLKGSLKVAKTKHQNYLSEAELPAFMKALNSYEGHILTQLGIKLVMHTMLRSSELRGGTWDEIDWEKELWRVPAERMKMKTEHLVPLTKQSLALLKEIQAISGGGDHLFPNLQDPRRGIMSENTLLYALYRLGYRGKATIHGFRATGSTILNENGFYSDTIEYQLAHQERDQVRAAYNHAKYLPQRREMMEWWSQYLEDVGKKSS